MTPLRAIERWVTTLDLCLYTAPLRAVVAVTPKKKHIIISMREKEGKIVCKIVSWEMLDLPCSTRPGAIGGDQTISIPIPKRTKMKGVISEWKGPISSWI